MSFVIDYLQQHQDLKKNFQTYKNSAIYNHDQTINF